jgi:hypothetical protein
MALSVLVAGDMKDDKLEGIWKEVMMAYMRYTVIILGNNCWLSLPFISFIVVI